MERFEKDKWYKSKATGRYFKCLRTLPYHEYAFQQFGTRNCLTQVLFNIDMLVPVNEQEEQLNG